MNNNGLTREALLAAQNHKLAQEFTDAQKQIVTFSRSLEKHPFKLSHDIQSITQVLSRLALNFARDNVQFRQ